MIPGVITTRGKGLYYQQNFTLTLQPQDNAFCKMLTGDVIHNISLLELCLTKNKGFELENIHLKKRVIAEKVSIGTVVSFHDRDFKYLGSEKATSGQYPISSLQLDKG